MILGRDFLRSQRCTFQMKNTDDLLHVQSHGQSVVIAQDQTARCTSSLNVILQESVMVPPCSEVEVMGRTPDAARHGLFKESYPSGVSHGGPSTGGARRKPDPCSPAEPKIYGSVRHQRHHSSRAGEHTCELYHFCSLPGARE